jgi:hypothetical protein
VGLFEHLWGHKAGVLLLSDVVEPLAAALASMAQGLHLDQVAVTADGALGQA